MKRFRNAIAALLLAIVFSTSAYADGGVIHTEDTPPPPPVQGGGVIHTEIAAPVPDSNALTEITLSLLQNLVMLL